MIFLADLGLLERTPRKGFYLKMSAAELAGVAFSAEDDDDEQLYFRIIDEHLGGRFTEDFTTTDLSQRYGLTTRQSGLVLSRMESEDLIRRKTARGWEFVRALSTVEAHDQSYRFRLIIEPAGLLEPGFAIDPAAFALHRRQQESLLSGQLALLSRSELFRYNATFHEMIAECSNNAFLADAVKRVNRMRRMIEYNHQADRTRLLGQAREHLKHRHLDTVHEIRTGIHVCDGVGGGAGENPSSNDDDSDGWKS